MKMTLQEIKDKTTMNYVQQQHAGESASCAVLNAVALTRAIHNKYSQSELDLFQHFGITLQYLADTSANFVYLKCVENAFLYDMSGPMVDALRAAYRAAFIDHSVFRNTPEFDRLLAQ